ncbi:PilZ domain-containing protein [Marinobacter mobilis]|uniref:PilZ domain-containing protein n=1 Tax=Marinobacter mobilis TaxID=488533 RepID=A0A1H2TCP3_9GAMM|nr:PilZ domain-containing protein [Marinobacter mobilis]SDW41733.1 PilZ domain-containing protein [Marinobacter mobilis]
MKEAAQRQPAMAGRVTMKPVPAKPNLREQQRVDVALEVCVKQSSGEELSCKAANLSRAGVMISCDSDTVQKLLPSKTSPAPGQWIQVSTRFAVPIVASQTVSVRAEGHIVHLRRVSRNEFHVGVHFTDFEDNGFDYLDQYVSRLLSAT